MCQHCSVWEVAPGERCLTHEGEIQQLFQRKSSSYISTALESKTTLAEDYGALSLGASAVFVSVHEVERNFGRSFWRPESDTPRVKTSPWHQITEIWLLGADKVSDWCRRLRDDFIRWDLQISCSLWNKYAVPPSGALRHIDRIHLSWERWLLCVSCTCSFSPTPLFTLGYTQLHLGATHYIISLLLLAAEHLQFELMWLIEGTARHLTRIRQQIFVLEHSQLILFNPVHNPPWCHPMVCWQLFRNLKFSSHHLSLLEQDKSYLAWIWLINWGHAMMVTCVNYKSLIIINQVRS